MLRSSPLRRTPITRTPMKRSRPAMPPPVVSEAREATIARAQELCEARLSGCLTRGTDLHHRITQKAGGRRGEAVEIHNRTSNTMWLCRVCHSWVTDRPREAYDLGLSLREYQDPSKEPVAYMDSGWVVLDDTGGLWPADEPAGAA